ncbi:MAG TPA: hypothetical protein VK861_08045 [Bacteroidales bacterium]|nr:hypothetical protein [Bacteroidales bacterium]
MEYSVLLVVIIGAFLALIAIQAYRLYSINRTWGYGEVVVRWISPEETRTILYIILALIALLIAIYIRSEALLSALSALLIGFGGMLSQLTFINIIGKEGIYLGRTRKGLSWEEIEKMSIIQDGNEYKLEITSAHRKKKSEASGFFEQIQRELESLETLDEPSTKVDVKTEKDDAGEMKIVVEDRLAKEREYRKQLEEKKREEELRRKREVLDKKKKPKEASKKKDEEVERTSHTIGFTEKHQFHIQQALMYYFTKGIEYKAPEERA